MPKRPRQHQLEAESRAAIRSLIPSRWVYRELDQDYGVDSEVEIFDESGSATGAKFLLQLKATDEPDLQKALRLWFPESKGNYYASLDLPVLIARYHAPSRRLFIRWFHSLDPYYGRRTRAGVGFRLTESDAWDDSTPDRIVTDVDAYREIKSPRLRGLLRFSLSIEGSEIHGVPAYALRLKLREATRQVQHLLTLETDECASAPSPHGVSINNEKIEVKLAGAHGFTLHTPRGYRGEDAASSLHNDIMVGIGLALDWHGHPVEASDLIAPFLVSARLSREPQTAFLLARCLARANQMHRALEVAEHFFRDDSSLDAAQVFLMPFLARRVGLLNSERDFGVRVLSRIAAAVERRGDTVRAAVLNYNSANLLRGMSRFREAIRHYRAAARLDSGYIRRPYFWRELAGVLFLSRRYALSARLYKQSLDLEEHHCTRCLYADALMFSGQYRAAEEIFEQQLESPVPPAAAEWALKRFALDWIRQQTGICEQRRREPQFPDGFNPKNLEDSEIDRVCKQALEADALCALAWFNLGGVRHRRGDDKAAAKCFLLAALIVPWDLEAWGNAIGLAIQTADVNLLGQALCASYQINGEDLLRHIVDRVPQRRDEFVSMLAQAVDFLPRRDQDFTIRAHHAGGGWDEVVVSPEGKVRIAAKND